MSKTSKVDVEAALEWIDGLKYEGQDLGSLCYEYLAMGKIVTDGGSVGSRACFEMAKPDRGLVRLKEQQAPPSAPLGVVTKSTWEVTDLGEAVSVARRKRERRAEIRSGVDGERT